VNLSRRWICKSKSQWDEADVRYALDGKDEDWDAALSKGKKIGDGMVVSVKSKKEKRKGESLKGVLDEYDKSNELGSKKKKQKH
jgi:hypothetical protein